MKRLVMKAPRAKKAILPEKKAPPTTAFDLWLQRGLRRLFDDVAQEPIPENLLKLIEDDRKK